MDIKLLRLAEKLKLHKSGNGCTVQKRVWDWKIDWISHSSVLDAVEVCGGKAEVWFVVKALCLLVNPHLFSHSLSGGGGQPKREELRLSSRGESGDS